MSGIGVVTNPMSRRNRRDPDAARSLAYVLGQGDELAAPDDLDALATTAAQFRDRDVGVVCINGGDGTVHQVLTAMVRAYGDAPLPPVALLPGGTMNIVAGSVGIDVSAQAMLGQVVESFHGGPPLRERAVPLLRVEFGDEAPYYGFLSGNGIIARFLELYYDQPDPTPMGAAALLAKGAASALVGGDLVRDLMQPWSGRVILDDHAPWPHDAWVAVAIGTVEQMGLGFRVFHLLRQAPHRMQVVGISGGVAELAWSLPSLYRGHGPRGPSHLTSLADGLVLEGTGPIPLMIDGDFYNASGGRVTYSLGPTVRLLLPG
ncbi:MAG: hypothetical protein KTR31_23095 [Myxococcales bacterium]|nr:hypothetical protein [Myxococcales bacterium]